MTTTVILAAHARRGLITNNSVWMWRFVRVGKEINRESAPGSHSQYCFTIHIAVFRLARYTDEVWYRAKVVEAGADASLQVFFIDFE